MKINNVYDTIVMVVNVQVADNDSGAAARWSQLQQIVKTAIYQFYMSMISNFFVIFEGMIKKQFKIDLTFLFRSWQFGQDLRITLTVRRSGEYVRGNGNR